MMRNSSSLNDAVLFMETSATPRVMIIINMMHINIIALAHKTADDATENAAANDRDKVAATIVRGFYSVSWVVVVCGTAKDEDGGATSIVVSVI